MNDFTRLRWVGVIVAVLQGLILVPRAGAFPAFARKYGVRCTACHEAWPVLNDFGRAFRDNGYQMMLGRDEQVKTQPEYWPISFRLTPRYEYDVTGHQHTDDGPTMDLASGSTRIGSVDMLTGGTLSKDVSFLVVPTGFSTPASPIFLESAWIRFDNIAGSSWLNLKLGKHEVDLPRSAHRPWNLSSTNYLIYSFHSPGSISTYDLGANQRGLEWVGHDRGSVNRAAVSLFSVEGSPGSMNVLDTPGIYVHGTHRWNFNHDGLTALRLGVFGAATSWPTTQLTAGGAPIAGTGAQLRESRKYGATADLWFDSIVKPLHAILVFAHGEDDRDLIAGATRDGIFNGGFLELGWSANLRTLLFFRSDLIRNSQQGLVTNMPTLNDESATTVGLRYSPYQSDRGAYALHAEYSNLLNQGAAFDGADLRTQTVFVGIDFAY